MNAPIDDPLDSLLVDGKKLLQKVRAHYAVPPETLPPNQQVTVAELDAWYRGVGAALERAFGSESYEMRTWTFRLKESRERSWEAVGNGQSPQGESFAVQLLAESIGTLAELKIARTGSQNLPNDSLRFASLHPKIAERCKALFATGIYEDAIFAAFRTIEEEVRRRSGSDATDLGVGLMSKAMNPKSPVLRFRAIDSEQEAVHSLFRGAIGAFKNPSSHRSVAYPDATRVLEFMAFASLLMHMLDAAEVK